MLSLELSKETKDNKNERRCIYTIKLNKDWTENGLLSMKFKESLQFECTRQLRYEHQGQHDVETYIAEETHKRNVKAA